MDAVAVVLAGRNMLTVLSLWASNRALELPDVLMAA